MRRRVRLGLFMALLGTAGLTIPAAVQALDYTDKPIEVSLDNPVDEESFPQAVNDATIISDHPEDCKHLPTCDTLSLVLGVPPNLIYRLSITTFFNHGDPTGAHVGANDLDIFYWQGTLVKGEWEWKKIGSSASAGQPERGKFGDLLPTTATNSYAITVSTFSGSSPYTVKAEITLPKDKYQGPPGQAPRPRQVSDPQTTGAKPSESKPFSPGALPLEELETVEPVKVPGPDGPLVEHELATAKGQEEADEKTNRTPLIVAVVALIAVGGATFLFFFLRARRQTV